MGREPIIVGMDPGTTTALAVFDSCGKLLATVSKRGFTRSAARMFILERGHPLAIASDITPVPRSIARIASSLGARIISPERELRWKDKKRVVEAFLEQSGEERPWKNAHERDALVAGFRAWKSLRKWLEKGAQAPW